MLSFIGERHEKCRAQANPENSLFEVISQSTSLLWALGMEKATTQSISCNDMTMAPDNNLWLFFIYKPVCSVPKCKQ